MARKPFSLSDHDTANHWDDDSFDFENLHASSFAPNGPDWLSSTPAPSGGAGIDTGSTAWNHGASGSHGPSDDSGSQMTMLDVDAFAKGGPAGGGGGGSGGTGPVAQYLSGAANGTAGYDILIEFKGTGWTAAFQKAFIDSADFLTTVITDDIGGGGSYRGKVIDDLYITAELKAIDGQGGILGQAGPTSVWTANDLTAMGQMQFDVADAANYLSKGLWKDIVMHEMMHVEGFGSLWNFGSHAGLVSGGGYVGTKGLEAYQAAGHAGATFIPVEQDGGPGTAGAHWDEQALGNELMTGYINNPNYLSAFSVLSLQDLGYKVSYTDPHDNVTVS